MPITYLQINIDRSTKVKRLYFYCSNQKQYILGSGHLVFNVSVHNEEEDSFGTIFKMKIPPEISYTGFEDLTLHKTELTVLCYSPKRENNYVIDCDIGNPLPSNKEVSTALVIRQ